VDANEDEDDESSTDGLLSETKSLLDGAGKSKFYSNWIDGIS